MVAARAAWWPVRRNGAVRQRAYGRAGSVRRGARRRVGIENCETARKTIWLKMLGVCVSGKRPHAAVRGSLRKSPRPPQRRVRVDVGCSRAYGANYATIDLYEVVGVNRARGPVRSCANVDRRPRFERCCHGGTVGRPTQQVSSPRGDGSRCVGLPRRENPRPMPIASVAMHSSPAAYCIYYYFNSSTYIRVAVEKPRPRCRCHFRSCRWRPPTSRRYKLHYLITWFVPLSLQLQSSDENWSYRRWCALGVHWLYPRFVQDAGKRARAYVRLLVKSS